MVLIALRSPCQFSLPRNRRICSCLVRRSRVFSAVSTASRLLGRPVAQVISHRFVVDYDVRPHDVYPMKPDYTHSYDHVIMRWTANCGRSVQSVGKRFCFTQPFRVGLIPDHLLPRLLANLEKKRQKQPAFAGRGARHQIICCRLFRSLMFLPRRKCRAVQLWNIPGPSTGVVRKIARGEGDDWWRLLSACRVSLAPRGDRHRGEIWGCRRCASRRSALCEKYYFTPGDLGFKNFDTPFGRIGVGFAWLMVSENSASPLWK